MTGNFYRPGQPKPPRMPARPGWPSLIVFGSVEVLLAVVTLATRNLVWMILMAAWICGWGLWFIRGSKLRIAFMQAELQGQHQETAADQSVSGDASDD